MTAKALLQAARLEVAIPNTQEFNGGFNDGNTAPECDVLQDEMTSRSTPNRFLGSMSHH
jgi:hypothetical protein